MLLASSVLSYDPSLMEFALVAVAAKEQISALVAVVQMYAFAVAGRSSEQLLGAGIA